MKAIWSAGRADHQDRLARLEPSALVHGQAGHAGAGQRGRGDHAQLRRPSRQERAGLEGRVLGQRAGGDGGDADAGGERRRRAEPEHLLPHLEPARTGADLGHGAGDVDVGAGDEREVQRDHLAYRARGHQQVGRVERGGGHPDLQLSRAGLEDREVFDGERAGRAVSGNDESFHEHPFQGDRLSLSRHPVRTGSPRPVSLPAFRLHLDRRLEVSREDAPRLPVPPRRRSGLPASPPW
jgi:hypothetical protein